MTLAALTGNEDVTGAALADWEKVWGNIALALSVEDCSQCLGIGRITVEGEAATIRRLELRHTAKQAVEILLALPRPPAAFTAEQQRRFFR